MRPAIKLLAGLAAGFVLLVAVVFVMAVNWGGDGGKQAILEEAAARQAQAKIDNAQQADEAQRQAEAEARLKEAAARAEAKAKAAKAKERAEHPERGVRGAGWMAAKQIVRPVLKSPASSDFPWNSVTFAPMDPLKDDSGKAMRRWKVSGAVDAQNALGTTRRSHWSAIALGDGDQIVVSKVSLEDNVLFESEVYKDLVARGD